MKRIAAIAAIFSLAIVIFFTAGCGQTSVYGTEGQEECTGPDRLWVDYSRGDVDQKIREAGLEKWNIRITPENFPLPTEGKECFSYHLLKIERALDDKSPYTNLNTQMIRDRIREGGDAPASIEHLIAYGKGHQAEVRQLFPPIMAIGERELLVEGEERIPCLLIHKETEKPSVSLCFSYGRWAFTKGDLQVVLVVRQIP